MLIAALALPLACRPSARLPAEDALRDSIARRVAQGPGTIVSLDSILSGEWRTLYLFGAYTPYYAVEQCVDGFVNSRGLGVQDGWLLFVLEPVSGRRSSRLVRGGLPFGHDATDRIYPRGAASFVVEIDSSGGYRRTRLRPTSSAVRRCPRAIHPDFG